MWVIISSYYNSHFLTWHVVFQGQDAEGGKCNTQQLWLQQVMLISEGPERAVSLAPALVVGASGGKRRPKNGNFQSEGASPVNPPHWGPNWVAAKLSHVAQNTQLIGCRGYQTIIHQQCHRNAWCKLIHGEYKMAGRLWSKNRVRGNKSTFVLHGFNFEHAFWTISLWQVDWVWTE